MSSGLVKGIPLSPGVAFGTAFLLASDADLLVPERSLLDEDVGPELERFEAALDVAQVELAQLQKEVAERIGPHAADIFEAQILVTRDHMFRGQVRSFVTERKVNAEAAVEHVLRDFCRALGEITDVYFRERAADLRDVSRRVISILDKKHPGDLLEIPPDSIVVSDELLPSTTARLDMRSVRGFVTERGGKTSHGSILARSLGIPAVGGLHEAANGIATGDSLIVDGTAGIVFVKPKKAVVREYSRLKAELSAREAALENLIDVPSQTRDGVPIKLCANIGKLADTEAALLFAADGIGLYRTEFAFDIRNQAPTEEEQLQIVQAVAERFHPRPVVFRVLDLGSDKALSYLPLAPSKNPSLGQRGVRLLFKHPEIFQTQLRAFLRASATHPVSILLPMVGGLEEVVEARVHLRAAMDSLAARKVRFNARVPLGAMIEVPSAALIAGKLADELEFFSLGTNDLIQYLLAADREDEAMAGYYRPLHPGVLEVIKSLATAVGAKGKELSVCGEMAADPAYTEVLLGLGLRSFSVSPRAMLEVKGAIRSCNLEGAERFAGELLQLRTASEIEERVANRQVSLGRTPTPARVRAPGAA